MTREEALAGHRRLWNEIADMIESGVRLFTADKYKENALFRIGETNEMEANCYCCHYTQGNCHVCPVVWNNEDENENIMCDGYHENGNGEYADFKEFIYERDYPAAADMARKIANLPERVSE